VPALDKPRQLSGRSARYEFVLSRALSRRVQPSLGSFWRSLKSNIDEIVYDFSKLLVARALLRFFAFYKKQTKGVLSVVDQLRAAIKGYSNAEESDRYLVAAFDAQLEKLTFYLLDRNGRDVVGVI
jgi:hypothetical protein